MRLYKNQYFLMRVSSSSPSKIVPKGTGSHKRESRRIQDELGCFQSEQHVVPTPKVPLSQPYTASARPRNVVRSCTIGYGRLGTRTPERREGFHHPECQIGASTSIILGSTPRPKSDCACATSIYRAVASSATDRDLILSDPPSRVPTYVVVACTSAIN